MPTKVHLVKAMVFQVVVYGCESWTIKKAVSKNWCLWIVVLEKTLQSPSDCKEIKPVNPKGNQPWIFIGRTYAKAEAPVLWPPDVKSQLLGKKAMTNPDSIWKSRDITLLTKIHIYSQSYGFSSSQVWMWEMDHKEDWAPKNWCFWIVVLEKTLESPLDCKEIKPANPKGNQPWIFVGRTDSEAETPILWPPHVKNWLMNKDKGANFYHYYSTEFWKFWPQQSEQKKEIKGI